MQLAADRQAGLRCLLSPPTTHPTHNGLTIGSESGPYATWITNYITMISENLSIVVNINKNTIAVELHLFYPGSYHDQSGLPSVILNVPSAGHV